MQVGMVGLGRMGSGLVARLLAAGHDCVVHDLDPEAVARLVESGATGAGSFDELVEELTPPRAIWVMLPAGLTGEAMLDLAGRLDPGDVLVDGGNSHYRDDVERARQLGGAGIGHVDVGTSGGVFGQERGFCLMIGGDAEVVARLEPLFGAVAPGMYAASRSPRRTGTPSTAEHGYLHCGGHGAGHFVKMVHNGIEYGLMAAYAEGLGVLERAGLGNVDPDAEDAETAPLRDREFYRFDFDVAEIAELWRRGSVVGSWLLDLTADALAADPELTGLRGRVSDSGEARWTVQAAIDLGVPSDVLSAALYGRLRSQGAADYGNRVLSAMRREFGGHAERASG